MITTTVVCGLGLKKHILGNMFIDYCSFCIWAQIAAKFQKNLQKVQFLEYLGRSQLKIKFFEQKQIIIV